MNEKMFNTRIVHKHDTAENWAKATGFVPKVGELIIYDPDENYAYSRIKMGDGAKTVSELPFIDEQKADKNEVQEMWYDIDDLKRNLDSKVSYTQSQSLSDSQKAQARQNIGAASVSEMTQVQADLSETNTEAKSYVNGVLQERHLPGYLPTEPQLDFKGFSDTPALTLTMAEEDWTKSLMSGYYAAKEADLNFSFDSRTSLRCIIDGTYYTLYPFIKEGNVFAWSTSDKATFLEHSFLIGEGAIMIRSATKFSKVEFYETQIRMDMENRQLPPEAIPLHFPTRSETKTLISDSVLITLDDIDAICNQSIESASEVLL